MDTFTSHPTNDGTPTVRAESRTIAVYVPAPSSSPGWHRVGMVDLIDRVPAVEAIAQAIRIAEDRGYNAGRASAAADNAREDDTYNGWTNRETWAAALHLSNDEGLYNACRELVADAEPAHMAADAIEEFVAEYVTGPVLHPVEHDEPAADWQRSMVADVGSFYRVDWRAVAESFREES